MGTTEGNSVHLVLPSRTRPLRRLPHVLDVCSQLGIAEEDTKDILEALDIPLTHRALLALLDCVSIPSIEDRFTSYFDGQGGRYDTERRERILHAVGLVRDFSQGRMPLLAEWSISDLWDIELHDGFDGVVDALMDHGFMRKWELPSLVRWWDPAAPQFGIPFTKWRKLCKLVKSDDFWAPLHPARDNDVRRIACNVYTEIVLDPAVAVFIDTRPVQRLKFLAQIGTCHHVYPGAKHCRFSHSLGTCFEAGRWMETLGRRWSISPRNIDLRQLIWNVQMAGLFHDLGHGPFSHSFEGFCKKMGKTFKHEEMSKKLVDYCLDECSPSEVEGLELTKNIRETIKLIIDGKFPCHSDSAVVVDCERDSFMVALERAQFDIVSNRRNGIDVDRMDYLRRDSRAITTQYKSNLSTFNDSQRLMQYSAVLSNGEIAFNRKVSTDLIQFYTSRFVMHDKVYCHPKVIAIDCMYNDVMMELEPLFHFCDRIGDPEEFLLLTDNVVEQVRSFRSSQNPRGIVPIMVDPERAEDNNARLVAAQNILKNLDERRIYKFAGEHTLRPETHRMTADQRDSAMEDFCSARISEISGVPSDLIITYWNYLTFGQTGKSPWSQPWDSIRFYTSDNVEESMTLSDSDIATFPQECVKVDLRVYLKMTSEISGNESLRHSYMERLADAPRMWARHFFPESERHPERLTPSSRQSALNLCERSSGQIGGTKAPAVLPCDMLQRDMMSPSRVDRSGNPLNGLLYGNSPKRLNRIPK